MTLELIGVIVIIITEVTNVMGEGIKYNSIPIITLFVIRYLCDAIRHIDNNCNAILGIHYPYQKGFVQTIGNF